MILPAEARCPSLSDHHPTHKITDSPAAPPPVTVAQLPFLAERDDVEWTLTETGHQGFYTVGPASERLRPRVRDALDALDSSGAAIGFLPEASLDDELLMVWRELLKNTPRPDKSSLTWLLLGSGPVLSVGSQPNTDRLTNRAVVLHRNGRDRPLLIQDKASEFCFTTQKQEDFKLDLGRKRDERIPHSRAVALLESRSGRFGVQICEDLNRLEHQQYVVAAGVTHLLVPVLAGAMWPGGWQANAGQQLALATGSKIAVGNSLA